MIQSITEAKLRFHIVGGTYEPFSFRISWTNPCSLEVHIFDSSFFFMGIWFQLSNIFDIWTLVLCFMKLDVYSCLEKHN